MGLRLYTFVRFAARCLVPFGSAMLACVCLLMGTSQARQLPERNTVQSVLEELVGELAELQAADGPPRRVAVGAFYYADTRETTEFSAWIAQELEAALGQSEGFAPITREWLQELRLESVFIDTFDTIVDKSGVLDTLKVKAVDALLLGRYYYDGGSHIDVKASFVLLQGGQSHTVSCLLPRRSVVVRELFPDGVEPPAPTPPEHPPEIQRHLLEAEIRKLLRSGQFREASEALDPRTDQEWRSIMLRLSKLRKCIEGIAGCKGSPKFRHVFGLEESVRELAEADRFWYDADSRWYGCAREGLEDVLDRFFDWLLEADKCKDEKWIALVNIWRSAGKLLSSGERVSRVFSVFRHSYETRSADLRRSLDWATPESLLIDPNSGLPLEVSLDPANGTVPPMRFVFVPAGRCLVGDVSIEGDSTKFVDVSDFFISKFEVSNQQYAAFCDTWGRPYPEGLQKALAAGGEQLPVTGVSHKAAEDFCRWLEVTLRPRSEDTDESILCRLPTECEFEKSARGFSLRRFTWGYEFDTSKCFNANTSRGKAQANTKSTPDLSFHGVANLAGNVSEWCADKWSPEWPARLPAGRDPIIDEEGELCVVVKGGNYTSKDATQMIVSARFQESPSIHSDLIGFRPVLILHKKKTR